MKLIKYSYKRLLNNNQLDWVVEDMMLSQVNLIVGKNSTGKSRFFSSLKRLCNSVKQSSTEVGNFSESWDLTFEDDGDEINYNLSMNYDFFSMNITEFATLNGKTILERDNRDALMFSFKTNENIQISPPEKSTAISIRRDKIEFPHLGKIIDWSETAIFFQFNELRSQYDVRASFILYHPSIMWSQFDKQSQNKIIQELRSIGFSIKNLWFAETSHMKFNTLFLDEDDLTLSTSENAISQGLYRAITILMYVEYFNAKSIATTLAIDDLGEGLDYERATKLGKLLVEKLENSTIQFIATSNDSFLMDVIPIKYWNILQRDGNTVRALNYQNSKEQFDNFKFTGLSNFDLFSSDYLMRPKP